MDTVIVVGTLLGALVLYFVVWCIQFHRKRHRLHALAEKFDGPAPLPIIGNALKCLIPLTEMSNALLAGSAFYKSPTRFWLGPFLALYVYNPEDIQIILNSPLALAKPSYYAKLLEPLTGRGLVISPVEEWKRHRKAIGPIFNQRVLEGYFDIFARHSEVLVNALKNQESKGMFDVAQHLVKATMDIVLESLLSIGEERTTSSDVMIEWIKVILGSLILKATKIWYFSDFLFGFSTMGKKFKNAKVNYNAYMYSLIEKWENNSINRKDDVQDTERQKPKKFAEHLLSISEGNGKFTAEELRGEVNTFIIAGLETTSSTMGYLLLMLGMHPDIQKKVYKEILHTLGHRKHLEYEDLKHLQYTERVIKETLRIFPPQAGLARYNDQELQLEKHTIPAETTIVIGLFSLHRDPKIWPSPTKFDPDRFLPDEEAKRHPYSWIPFSGGPRNCIGIRFAWMALKIMLSNIVLNYKVETMYKSVEDIDLTMILAFHPTNGYKISIARRSNQSQIE